jgi:hypothetical protein
MLAWRNPLLWAFAGGCLSGAALIGVWRVDSNDSPRVTDTRTPELDDEPAAAAPPSYAAPTVQAIAAADDSDDDATALEPTPAVADATPEPGSSVADILVRLEVAYRQRAVTAPEPVAAAEPAPTPAPAAHVAAVVAVSSPAASPAVVTAVAAPPAAVPTPVADTETEPLAARDDARPRDVHIGDVNQNTTVNNVHKGDVYVVQPYVQYVPYFAGYASSPYATQPLKRGYPAQLVPAPRKVTAPDSYSVFKYPVDLVH